MTRQSILHRLCCIMANSDITAIRLMLALGALFWAGVLFWSGDIFSRDVITYGVIARIGGEYFWGALFFTQGAFAFYALFRGRRTDWHLLAGAALGCVIWTMTTLAILASRLHEINSVIGISGELVFMIASWLNFVRVIAEREDSRE